MSGKLFFITILGLAAVLLSAPLLGCSKPPAGLESPRWLTQAEKDKVIEVAFKTVEAREWVEKGKISSTNSIWMALIWDNSDFSGFYSIRYEWTNDDNLRNVPQEAVWYPGVIIRFGDPAEWQVTAAVDLDSEKAVYVTQNPYRTGPRQEIEISPAPIHEVRVNIAESFPPQVILYIQGGLRDGCTTFHELTTERNGNSVNVRVTTEHPKGVECPAVYGYFDENVNLGSDFVSGETYHVNVNDYSTSFKMQ
ncbi:hypothetical protein ACFLVX_00805 [Chloroflexota bacterium]